MKDNKNEPMQMLKASMQKATFLKFLFLGLQVFYKIITVQPLV